MRLAIRPFGVLGTRLTAIGAVKKVGQAPVPGFPIVDPAGLPFIRNGPRGASGASGEIYRWLGIADEESFPTPVREAITAPLQAALQYYGLHGCIHVAGPDFNGRGCSREEALGELTAAYGAVPGYGAVWRRAAPYAGGVDERVLVPVRARDVGVDRVSGGA